MFDDFEKIRDDVEERIKQAWRRHYARDHSVYTNRDLGIKHVEEVYPGYDHGATNWEIQAALDKISRHEQVTQRERRVNRFLQKVASEGFYGYLKLRKMLGFPLESFRVKPWYAQRLEACLSLVNPGGLVWLSEGVYKMLSTVTVKQNQGITATGKGATILKPMADIDVIVVKPSVEYGELGTGISIQNLMIKDEDNVHVSKSGVVLDGTDKHISNVFIEDVAFDNLYNCVKNVPKTSGGNLWDPTLWNWHNTLKDLVFTGFKYHALHFQNVADCLFFNLWMVSDKSSTSAILIEKIPNASLKIGGNMFAHVRVYNEKTVNTAHGIHVKDVGEMWFEDVIVEASGVSLWFQGCWNLFLNQVWGCGLPPNGMLAEGFKLDPVEKSQFINCHAHNNGLDGFLLLGKSRYNTFVNCVAANNSRVPGANKHGFMLWGYSATDRCEHNRFVNCKAYDDQDVHTQYGGLGERSVYTDYNYVIGMITFGNISVSVNLQGPNSRLWMCNEVPNKLEEIQWGTASTDSNGDATVYFPKSFRSVPYVFCQSDDGYARGIILDVIEKTTTYFKVKSRRTTEMPIDSTVSSYPHQVNFLWFAVPS